MIIDAHVHIFPAEIVKNREMFFEGEPEFKALYDNPKARLSTLEDILAMQEINGVDHAVVCGFPWRQPRCFMMHNDYLAAAQQKYPRQITALGAFYIPAPEAVQETERCLAMDLKGLGELAFYTGDLSADVLEGMAPVMEICLGKNVPVLLHANETVGHGYAGKATAELSDYYRFCQKFSLNKIILAHWGGGLIFYKMMKREVKAVLQNVWFDTAALPYLYDDNIYDITVKAVGCSHILFGSDYPLIAPKRYIDTIRNSSLPVEDQDAILGLNAKTLFNL